LGTSFRSTTAALRPKSLPHATKRERERERERERGGRRGNERCRGEKRWRRSGGFLRARVLDDG